MVLNCSFHYCTCTWGLGLILQRHHGSQYSAKCTADFESSHYFKLTFTIYISHRSWAMWAHYICEYHGSTHFAIISSLVDTKLHIKAFSSQSRLSYQLTDIWVNSLIYLLLCLSFQTDVCYKLYILDLDFGFKLGALWCHSGCISKVIHVSLNQHNSDTDKFAFRFDNFPLMFNKYQPIENGEEGK